MAILAVVAVPSYENIIENAENNLALANINIIRKFVTSVINLNDFTNEEMFKYVEIKPTPEEDVNYLSRYIEVMGEELGDDTDTGHSGNTDNGNYLNILNPTSTKVCIVNWSDVVNLCSRSFYARESMYISDNTYLSYTPDSPRKFD